MGSWVLLSQYISSLIWTSEWYRFVLVNRESQVGCSRNPETQGRAILTNDTAMYALFPCILGTETVQMRNRLLNKYTEYWDLVITNKIKTTQIQGWVIENSVLVWLNGWFPHAHLSSFSEYKKFRTKKINSTAVTGQISSFNFRWRQVLVLSFGKWKP